MDQEAASSTVLRLLRRLCAAAPGPGGAWREELMAFLWRLWSRLQACKNLHRAAPVPVADTRTLDGDHAQATEDVSKDAELDIGVMSKNDGQAELRKDGDDAQATEDDDDYLAKKEGDDAGYFSCETEDTEHDDEGYFSCETQDDKERAFGIQSDDARSTERALDIEVAKLKNGQDTHLASAADLSKGKNDGQAELRKDGDDAQATEDDDDYLAKKEGDDAGYFSCETQDTEHADEGYFSSVNEEDADADADSKNDRAFGIQSDDADDKERDVMGNNAELDGPAVIGNKKGFGVCSQMEVQKAPALAPWGSARAGRAPARAVEEEDDDRRAIHLKYVELCASFKGNKTYCFSCFMESQQKKPAEIEKRMEQATKHMDSSHKSSSNPRKCKKKGCFAMSRISQDIGHHEKFAHGL
ncbi:putative surface protein SACOL0050 [Hordeum vulgare subsp. vulgare]|uniref:putative surface protein SACOL0050 n=1 Tax=Hordeum vulgare subsp. vulgare TaxID=112509 RepID=UPI001D1A4F22|nr:putative surface protein SACOL0050 [Hordeum vulgare subsp. vulgare]XP_044947552.1 putative surface protein SACOL0050 [Hordeum vulgare subsp. vulgare]